MENNRKENYKIKIRSKGKIVLKTMKTKMAKKKEMRKMKVERKKRAKTMIMKTRKEKVKERKKRRRKRYNLNSVYLNIYYYINI